MEIERLHTSRHVPANQEAQYNTVRLVRPTVSHDTRMQENAKLEM